MALMKTHGISQSPNKAQLQQKESPKNRFQKALEKASEIDHEEKKKKKPTDETPLLDGPVTANLTTSISAETNKPDKIPTLSKVSLQIINEIKPKLITLSENGISKTIVHINSDLLSNVEIEIDHFDTNPSQFIITFRGDEKAQQIIFANLSQLTTSLKGALPNFQCTFAPSTFRTLIIKKKKSTKNNLVKTAKVRYCANNSGE